MSPIINTTEHSVIGYNFTDDKLKEFNKLYTEKDKQYLGLHQEFENNNVVIKSYYYIGYRWFDEEKEEYIHIAPKKSNGYQADYLKMFLTCLKDPIVSKKLDDCYEIKFSEKWIKIENNEDEITPFLILHFLSVVKKISQKGLKKGYVKVTENFTSKIKGKILVNQTIKHNHFKNRLDKTVCNHQILTIDCLENKILKTALIQSSRYLHSIGNNDDISKLLKYNLSSFELVASTNIHHNDFAKIKHSPFYKEYKEALRLAQMIFKRLGFTLNNHHLKNNYKVPPFSIDMPELFERYAEVKLRAWYRDNLKAGYSIGNGYETSIGELRPDFIVRNENLIIDAKYKYWFSSDSDKRFKDDFQQLALYGRVEKIKDDIGLENNRRHLAQLQKMNFTSNSKVLDLRDFQYHWIEFCKKSNILEAKILFIYPQEDGVENINDPLRHKVKGFNYIYKLGIKIPQEKVRR